VKKYFEEVFFSEQTKKSEKNLISYAFFSLITLRRTVPTSSFFNVNYISCFLEYSNNQGH